MTSSVIGYYIQYPQQLSAESADFFNEKNCLEIVTSNINGLNHIPERYRTETVCMVAFLKHRMVDDRIVRSIPFYLRCPEMWVSAIEQGASSIESVPINMVTPDVVCAYVKYCFSRCKRVELSLFTQKQRELIYPMLYEHVTKGNLFIMECVEKSSFLGELVESMIAINQTRSGSLNLYQFKGIELTGLQANQIGHQLKFIKLTYYGENHNGLQYNDGKNDAKPPFDIYEHMAVGGIYFTTKCKEKIFTAKYDGSGEKKLYWRRPIILEPNARICVESDHHIKCNTFILGQRTRI